MVHTASTVATPLRTSVDRIENTVDTSVDTSVDGSVDESPLRDGRSENSLAVLCQRFCALYRDHPDPINIDHAAKELGIQRRRMYEILNIIQSVGLVVRLRASFYRWEGQASMTTTLERLKADGMARQEEADGSAAAATSTVPREGQRKKAVATALGERFVQIFLCNEVPQPIVLEDIMGLFTACMGGALTNQMSCARRLYDIANVFCAVGLITKSCSSATDHRRKKRLYSWIGPVLPLATPVRPHRAATAPNVSPGSSSAKRSKTEPSQVLQRRSKKLKSSLEESIVKAESLPAEALGSTLMHPARLSFGTAVRLSRALETSAPPRAAHSNPFFPINAKDGADDLIALSTPKLGPPKSVPFSQSEQKAPQPVGRAAESKNLLFDAKDDKSDDLDDSTPNFQLRVKVENLTKALEEARGREKELLKRIEAQDSQITKLLEARQTEHKPLSASYMASPLTSFLLSPFPKEGCSGAGVTPSPLTNFSTGLTGTGCRYVHDQPRMGVSLNDPRCTSPKASAYKLPPSRGHSSMSTPLLGPKTKDSSVLATPPSRSIAAAASSLLSLTPSQHPPESPSIDLLALAQLSPGRDKENSDEGLLSDNNEASVAKTTLLSSSVTTKTPASAISDRTARRLSSCVLESPASLKSTFDGISPLPKSCLSDC